MYWKTLSREERQKWEEKAVIAQAEHRKRYPDWRFRPGANAMAKLKIKDGGGGSTRKRSILNRIKDQPTTSTADGGQEADVPKDKGKGKGKAKEKITGEEKRCAKIADFLVKGKKGLDLEVAVKEWEGGRSSEEVSSVGDGGKAKGRGTSAGGAQSSSRIRTRSSNLAKRGQKVAGSRPDALGDASTSSIIIPGTSIMDLAPQPGSDNYTHRSRSPERPSRVEATGGNLAKIPLTHMFKRSLSAPASNHRFPHSKDHEEHEPRTPVTQQSSPPVDQSGPPPSTSYGHVRRDTVSFPMNPADFAAQHIPWPDSSWWRPADSDNLTYNRSQLNTPMLVGELDYAGSDVRQLNQAYSEVCRYRIVVIPCITVVDCGDQQGGVHISNWGTVGGHDLTEIDDPYLHAQSTDPSASSTPISPSPPPLGAISSPTISPTIASTSTLAPTFYAQQPSLPSSSFSTLSGWAGEYPQFIGSIPAKPVESDGHSIPPRSTLNLGWQQNHGWHNQLQPMGLQGGSGGWGQSQMGMDLGSPSRSSRKVTFQDHPYRLRNRPYRHVAPLGRQELQGSVYDTHEEENSDDGEPRDSHRVSSARH